MSVQLFFTTKRALRFYGSVDFLFKKIVSHDIG